MAIKLATSPGVDVTGDIVGTQILANDWVVLCIMAMLAGVNLTMPSHVHEPDVSRPSLWFVVPSYSSSSPRLKSTTSLLLTTKLPAGGGKPGSIRDADRKGDAAHEPVPNRTIVPG